MVWSILGVTIGFTRFKIMRSYENIYCETIPLFLFFSHQWFLQFEVNGLSLTTNIANFLLRFFRRVKANERGSEQRSGLLSRTAFFAQLSLHSSATLCLPPAWKIHMQQRRLFCSLRYLTSKVSMVTVVVVLSCHAIRQITRSTRLKPSEANFHKKLREVELVLCD